MSLPKVSYGNYNYGQYANPTPIQYKGGLGEGLAGAAKVIGAAIQKNREETKKKNEAADVDAALSSRKYKQALNKVFGKASVENKQYIINKKKEYGETVKQFKLGNLKLDEYTEKMDEFDNLLNQITLLKESIGTAVEMNKGDDIAFGDLRQNEASFDAEMKRRNLINGKFKIVDRDDGEGNMIPMLELQKYTGSANMENEVSTDFVTVKDLIENNKIFTPEIRYEHATNANITTLETMLTNEAKKKQLTKYVDSSTEGYHQSVIDPDRKDDLKEILITNGKYKNALTPDQRKQFYEDVLAPGEKYNQSNADQNKLIDDAVLNQILDNVSGNAVGNEVRKVSGSDDKVGDAIQSSLKNMDAINTSITPKFDENDIPFTGPQQGIDTNKLANLYNNNILGKTGAIQQEDGVWYLKARGEAYLGEAFKQKLNMNDLDSVKRAVAVFLYGARAHKYVGTGLPTNK